MSGLFQSLYPKLEFPNVQRQIFAAELVATAHNAALQERPETINRLSMDDPVNVLPSGVADRLL